MIIDAAPTLIYYIDRDERFRFSNQAFATRYGLALRDIVGRRLAEVIGTERTETLQPHLRAALAGHSSTFEMSDTADDGDARQLQVSYAPDAPDGRYTAS